MIRPTNYRTLVNLVLRAIAVAMGIAVVVMQILHTLVPDTAVTLLGLGLLSLALAAMQPQERGDSAMEG